METINVKTVSDTAPKKQKNRRSKGTKKPPKDKGRNECEYVAIENENDREYLAIEDENDREYLEIEDENDGEYPENNPEKENDDAEMENEEKAMLLYCNKVLNAHERRVSDSTLVQKYFRQFNQDQKLRRRRRRKKRARNSEEKPETLPISQ